MQTCIHCRLDYCNATTLRNMEIVQCHNSISGWSSSKASCILYSTNKSRDLQYERCLIYFMNNALFNEDSSKTSWPRIQLYVVSCRLAPAVCLSQIEAFVGAVLYQLSFLSNFHAPIHKQDYTLVTDSLTNRAVWSTQVTPAVSTSIKTSFVFELKYSKFKKCANFYAYL